jgi:hypothetical protein
MIPAAIVAGPVAIPPVSPADNYKTGAEPVCPNGALQLFMTPTDYIPTGRTSLVKKGPVALQVQSEFASRPVRRITTTVLKSGQVIHKIERHLDGPIDTLEEKSRVEEILRKQHAEVLSIIDDNAAQPLALPVAASAPADDEYDDYMESVEQGIPEAPAVEQHDRVLTVQDRLLEIPGMYRVYRLDHEGGFQQVELKDEFRKTFGAVFKSLRELISVFAEIPGVGLNRELGVYEIERDRLYLVSSGIEYFICYLKRPDISVDYEKAIRSALPPDVVW